MPPFKKGDIGNPAGRPVGSRGKATIAAQVLMEGERIVSPANASTPPWGAIALPCDCVWNAFIRSAKAPQ
jgi:hypothetical protein